MFAKLGLGSRVGCCVGEFEGERGGLKFSQKKIKDCDEVGEIKESKKIKNLYNQTSNWSA
jgi:hypothetical protein